MAATSPATPRSTALRRDLLIRGAAPLAIFLATLLLYLTTLTEVHTFDALSYVMSVESKPWPELLHPHHLAYGPLGVLALWAGQVLGHSGAALPMQLVNAVAGAAGVALFFAIVRRALRRVDLALVAALLLGGTYAFWYYAVEVEVYTVATLFLLIALGLLLECLRHPTARAAALVGLAQGGAVLFHQTNVLFCVPVLVCWILNVGFWNWRSKTQNPKLGVAVAYIVALALTVGVPYVLAAFVVSGFRTWDELGSWLFEYARTGWWGGPITPQKWESLGEGLADTIAQPGGALLGLLLVGLLVLHLRTVIGDWRLEIGDRERRWNLPASISLLAVVWLLAYGAFFLWWEPDNVEFWIASLPPALLLLAQSLRRERPWGPSTAIALAVGVTALGVNYDSIARRGDPATDLQRAIAGALAAQSTPADLLLVPDGLQELYLPHYEGREQILSLNQALFDSGGDWARACGAIEERIETALHAGATAFIADEVLRPPQLLLDRHRLLQSQVDACFARYRSALLPAPMPGQAPAYWRLPRAQDLAGGAGWSFAAGPEGWRAAGVGGERFADGWRFVPQVDAALMSPLLQVDASEVTAIEIRLANGTRSRDAQLFYAGPDGRIDEERSVRWELEATPEPATYRVELRGAPGWDGVIARLRLDPVGVGDGGEIVVERIRLIH